MKFNIFYFLLILLSIEQHVSVLEARANKYDIGDDVIAWKSAVFPDRSKQSRLPFDSLPYCQPTNVSLHRHYPSLSERLFGIRLYDSGFFLKYGATLDENTWCTAHLSASDIDRFRNAIRQDTLVEFLIDDLPVWTPLGILNDQGSPYLATRYHFHITYNRHHLIDAAIHPMHPILLNQDTKSQDITFTYSVSWEPTNVSFDDRWSLHAETHLANQKMSWFSIVKSLLITISLAMLVLVVLVRQIRASVKPKDSSSSASSGHFLSLIDDEGWKALKDDVFGMPNYMKLFAFFLGTGAHLLTALLLVSAASFFVVHRQISANVWFTCHLIAYIVTSFVSGFVSMRFYEKHHGQRWREMMIMSALLSLFVAWSILIVSKLLAAINHAQSMSTLTMLVLMFIFLILAMPLQMTGSHVARKFFIFSSATPRNLPSPTPFLAHWYQKPWFLVLVSSLVSLLTVVAEMQSFVYAFWNQNMVYLFDFMTLTGIVLAVVSACVSILTAYRLLCSHYDRWMWPAFVAGGGPGFNLWVISLIFFFTEKPAGVYHSLVYLGFSFLLSLCAFLVFGTIGYASASRFVSYMYSHAGKQSPI